MIAGIDEAGRGALAGPVVVCACVLLCDVQGLDDSKKLSAKQRENLAKTILANSITTIAIGPSHQIDVINILQATLLAMKRAATKICRLCEVTEILIDGNKIPTFMPCSSKAVLHGDQCIAQIMAASIVAKVTRDHIMEGHGNSMPGYGFEIHKGYGTRLHYKALSELGPSKIHRRSFRLC